MKVALFRCAECAQLAPVTPYSPMKILNVGYQGAAGRILVPAFKTRELYAPVDNIYMFHEVLAKIRLISALIAFMLLSFVDGTEVLFQTKKRGISPRAHWTRVFKPGVRCPQVVIHVPLGEEDVMTRRTEVRGRTLHRETQRRHGHWWNHDSVSWIDGWVQRHNGGLVCGQ